MQDNNKYKKKKNSLLLNRECADFCIILCTVPNTIDADLISKELVTNNLAPCVTIIPEIVSIYQWEGEIKNKTETQLIIKSRTDLKEKIFNKIKSIHPYQVPEILLFPIADGNYDYLIWINKILCKET